ncbi:MAG: dihydrofolate reductase [Halieaceae bacterium]|jgi:dihydrofolate reductase|nr:dihydrofolate reductase [Halieaceae bacterium]
MKSGMSVALIAAVSDNGVIGRDNRLPWYIPADLRYFKQVTLGKPVIMGRKTWESMNRPLPGRTNIVITRQADYVAEGARVVPDLAAAIELAESVALIDGIEEIMIIGGAEIYRLALPAAKRLYLTEVHADVEGDTFFPDWDRGVWQEASREQHEAPGSDAYRYSFAVYERAPN